VKIDRGVQKVGRVALRILIGVRVAWSGGRQSLCMHSDGKDGYNCSHLKPHSTTHHNPTTTSGSRPQDYSSQRVLQGLYRDDRRPQLLIPHVRAPRPPS
jgi:hypothetical protein